MLLDTTHNNGPVFPSAVWQPRAVWHGAPPSRMYCPSSSHPHSGQPWLRTSLNVHSYKEKEPVSPCSPPCRVPRPVVTESPLASRTLFLSRCLTGFRKRNKASLRCEPVSLVPSALHSLQSCGSQPGRCAPGMLGPV